MTKKSENKNLVEIRELHFPTWDDFQKMKLTKIKDYVISFAIEVRHTEIGELKGTSCFYITAPDAGLTDLRNKPFSVTKENYEKAKEIIDEHRRARIEALL